MTCAFEVNDRRGFSLLELLWVCVVIAIVLGLAIPNLISSRKAAYEATTIQYLRALATAQETYHLRFGAFSSDFGTLESERLIHLPDSGQLGYSVSVSAPPGIGTFWSANADPASPGTTGDRYFYIDVTGVMREAMGGSASSSSPPLNYAD